MTTKEKNKISNFPNQSASPLSPYLALHVCHDAKIEQFPRRKIPLSKGILGCLVLQAHVLVVNLFVEDVEVSSLLMPIVIFSLWLSLIYTVLVLLHLGSFVLHEQSFIV